MLRSALPRGRDWIGVALLGVGFFAVFFVLYNVALAYTTAARGALALSTLPLWTMVVAALAGAEPLTRRKTLGVLTAVGGVAIALVGGSCGRAAGRLARRSDHARLDALHGVLQCLVAPVHRALFPARFRHRLDGGRRALLSSRSPDARRLCGGRGIRSRAQWVAVIYLGAFGGAAAFFLWVLALRMTTPTRVANTMTVNPIAASLLAAIIVAEPVGWNLVLGLVAVAGGIWLAQHGVRATKK